MRNFCVVIKSRDDLPNPESLKIKLIEEEARREETDTGSKEERAANYQETDTK